jgi:hypothetical protein
MHQLIESCGQAAFAWYGLVSSRALIQACPIPPLYHPPTQHIAQILLPMNLAHNFLEIVTLILEATSEWKKYGTYMMVENKITLLCIFF